MGHAVLVYRSHFLSVSETFISDHIRSLRRYTPYAICETDEQTEHRSTIRSTVIGSTPVTRALFAQAGYSPSLTRLVKTAGARLIHAHFLNDGVRVMRFSERAKLPLVVTAHGFDATISHNVISTSASGRRYLRDEQKLIDCVHTVICVSDFIRDQLIEKGYPAGKLVVIPLGVDNDHFAALRKPQSERRGLITIGRLVEKKGTRYLLEAYARLPVDLQSQLPLTVVGDGPLRGELEAYVHQTGLPVRLLGALPRSETLRLLAGSSIFAFPSVRAANGDAEGMPIALMEAMALGVPIVAFDERPMTPLLEESGSGLLAPSKSPEGLAHAIAALAGNPDLAATVAANGERTARNRFELTTNVSLLEDLYDEVVASRMPVSVSRRA